MKFNKKIRIIIYIREIIPTAFTIMLSRLEKFRLQSEMIKNNPDSPTNEYYAFLSEIDDVTERPAESRREQVWTVMFEIVPKEWMDVFVFASPDSRQPLPSPPASFLYIEREPAIEIAEALDVDADEIQETDWYIITLGAGKGKGAKATKTTFTGSSSSTTTAAGRKAIEERNERAKRRMAAKGNLKLKKLTKQLKPLTTNKSIGVMDVGQANYNIILNENGNHLAYFDVGLPMFFYQNSAPPAALLQGPCIIGNAPVILSHWHYDHYSMAIWWPAISNRHWLVPAAPLGPGAQAIYNGIAHPHVWPNALPGLILATITVLRCDPANINHTNADINNSGLALEVTLRPAAPNQAARHALLPGDAVFATMNYTNAGLRWITAVHHGSQRSTGYYMDTAGDYPTSNNGYIAYSYGMTANNTYCYTHPHQAAITLYEQQGWDTVASNAQTTPRQAGNAMGARGNIMVGVNMPTVVPCANHNCPFHTFPAAKRLLTG